MPEFSPGLADIRPAGSEPQEAFQFGVLVAIGGVEVDVEPGRAFLREGSGGAGGGGVTGRGSMSEAFAKSPGGWEGGSLVR